ncbi:DUF4326 domain-containing protein [Streptomyces sp. NPDC053705]|uniref:DUF4326 domain-containing protein n=1 Tax=Streptomyces sp. NPDC053705 TaxID=3156668 RepID=UPI0034271F2E
MPARIKRQRTPGWRAPSGSTYVGRGSRWGNPYEISQQGRTHTVSDGRTGGVIYSSNDAADARRVAVAWFRAWIDSQSELLTLARQQLARRDLMCWCPLPEPGQPDHCHAAVLLELANAPEEN